MKKIYFAIAIFMLANFSSEIIAQKDQDLPSKKTKENIVLDTRIDNMGYWNRMIELGVTKGNPSIPFKPAEYKGSFIEANANGIKAQDSPDVPVTSATNVTETENSIFIDPNDNQYVLNSNNSTSWTGSTVGTLYGANYFQSADGGATYGGSASGAGGNNSGDPTTAINHNGRQFVNYISGSSGQGVAYSDDGINWTTATVGPNPGSLADKNHMWIDNSTTSTYNGNLYAAWTDFGGTYDNQIVLSRSINDGVGWSTRINLSAASSAGSHNQGVNVQTGPNGEVYVVWAIYDSWPSDETRLAMAKSTNGGATFGSAYDIITNINGIRSTEVPQNMRVNSFPVMAADISGGSYDGNVYVVWTNVGTPGVNSGTAGVYMIRSTNGGTVWSTPVKVNQGTGTAYQPWITCDSETGALAVVYYDNRGISSSDAATWVSYSLDAGNTWTDLQVSDVSFTPTPIPGLAGGYMGDYLGITSKGGRVYPCWADNRASSSTTMTYVSPFELGLNASFTADNTTVCTGSTVTFTDQSSGSPTSWNWTFTGGTPASATGPGPHTVTYNTANSYQVSLTVGDGASNDTETIPNYITVQNIIADYTANPTTVVVGSTVTFTDNSSCNPTSWSWSFPGGTPATASGSGPHTVTYNSVGLYTSSLTVVNGSNNDTETVDIDVINCNYCATSYSNTTDDYISNVSFNTINNPSGSTTYSDFTSISTNVTTGNSYSISANITVNGAYLQNCWVWIDWNRDCDFDDAGESFDLGETPGTSGTHTLSTNITIPAGASLGSTRMRISELWNTDPTPCTVSTYGEAEDYTVVIQSTSTPPVADFSADDTAPAIGQTVNFSDQSSGSPTSWSWSFNPATITYVGGTNSGSQNPQVQFNASGYYTVTLTATNVAGSDPETKTNYILAGTAGNWTGVVSVDWNTGGNWENFMVPTSSDNVIIPATAPNWPTYTGNLQLGTQCLDITLEGACELTITGDLIISSGNSLTCTNNALLMVGGDWTNNGTFNPGTGTVEFMGSNNSVLTGPAGSGVFFYDGFESNLGWSLSGEFERGVPTGLGGDYGNPDPGSAFAGSNVLGVDLSGLGTYPGDYENSLGDRAYQAISPTINCTGFTNVSMNFQRWLGVEQPSYDHAYIDISTDNGSNWIQVWTNTAGIEDASWGLQNIDISAYADNQSQVKIMFSIGTSDGSWQYCGWNIDEFELSGDGGSSGETFYNLTISKTNAEAITTGDIDINGNFTINPAAWFTNASGNTINVLGNAVLSGDNTDKASFIDNGTLNVAGTTLVRSYYTDGRWHFISSPVSNAVSNIFLDIYLKEWDESTYTWNYIVPIDYLLAPGTGYEIWSTLGNPVIDYIGGSLNSGNITPAMTATDVNGGGIGVNEGWNLVGNPYASAIDWGTANNPVSGYVRTNIDNAIYIWTGTQYATYNPSLNGGDGVGTNGGSQFIQSMQSVFVKANTTSPVLTIPNNARVHTAQANLKTYGDLPQISLQVEGNGDSDEIYIEVNESSSDNFDNEFDAYKLWGSEASPQLYVITPGNDLSIHVIPSIEIDDIINIGFKAGEENTYVITALQLENFDDFDVVMLEDQKTGTVTDLLVNPTYSFEYETGDDEHRFNLYFTGTAGLDELHNNSIQISSYQNTVFIKNPALLEGNIVIYNMLGQKIISTNTNRQELIEVPVSQGLGYYFVSVISDSLIKSEKVLIK